MEYRPGWCSSLPVWPFHSPLRQPWQLFRHFFALSAGGGSLYIIFVLNFELLLPLLYYGVSQRKSNIYTLDWSNIGNALLLGEPFISTCHWRKKKLLHQTALTGWDDRCLNFCVFFAVFVTKLKNKRREGGFSSLKVLIKICQKTTLQITDEITVANIWPYDFLLMGLWSCGAECLQWLWMLSSVTLQLWLIQSMILFFVLFLGKTRCYFGKD